MVFRVKGLGRIQTRCYERFGTFGFFGLQV